MNTAADTRPALRTRALYEVVGDLERHFGAALVHNPRRWGTADGTIEYRHAHLYADLMRRQQAFERLHLARATVMGSGSENARALARDDEQVSNGR